MNKELFVPIYVDKLNEENNKKYLAYLKEVKANVVYIAMGRFGFFVTKEKRIELFSGVIDSIRFFEKEGFSVGCWITSFGFGNPLTCEEKEYLKNEPHITSILGRVGGDAFCPEGKEFKKYYGEYVKDIARIINPPIIMLDDEMCLSVRPGVGCFCDEHIKLYNKEFGENLTRDELKDLIFTGYNEKYRKGYLKVVGNSMRNFCRFVREELDKVNSNTRLGFCAGYTSWDLEGADALELTKILAGKNKPFLRLSGAPYWPSKCINRFNGQSLHEVIDFVRLQEKFCRDENIEIMHECDPYPRPCTSVSSSLAECYDVALRASGNISSFKYMFCYDANPDYEKGYIKRHVKNMPLYEFIEKHFSNKKSKGVYIADKFHTLDNALLPKNYESDLRIMANFPLSSYLMQMNSIPTQFDDNSECSVIFGENARSIEELPKKIICDLGALKILKEKGFDVGINEIGDTISVGVERFGNRNTLGLFREARSSMCALNKNALIKSDFTDIKGNSYPFSYIYNNGKTEIFGLLFDSLYTLRTSMAFLSYERRKDLQEFVKSSYPIINNVSGVYSIVKEDEKETAVLFENITEEELSDFEIELNGKYKEVEFFNGSGVLDNDVVKFTSIVNPYGIFALILKKR